MRNLLTGILLTVSLPTMADVASDVANNLSAADILSNATAACATSACTEQALTDMLNAGIAIDSVAQVAADSGISVTAVMKAAKAAGVAETTIVASVSKAGATSDEINTAANDAGISPENVIAGKAQADTGTTASGTTDTNNTKETKDPTKIDYSKISDS